MEFQCVMCLEGKCSPDCPTLDVLPNKEPVAEENIQKAQKLVALGMDIRYIKRTLKIAGDFESKNQLIDQWLLEFETKEKDPLPLLILEKRIILAQRQKLISEKKKTLESLKAELKTWESLKAEFKKWEYLKAEVKTLESLKADFKTLESLKSELKNQSDLVDELVSVVDEGLSGLEKCSTVFDGTTSPKE